MKQSLVTSLASALWHGPAGLPRELKLEWRFVAVRWVGITFMAPGLILAHLPADRLSGAYAVLVLAAIYNIVVQRTITRWPRLYSHGYVTTLGDALLNIGMVTVGGGFNSPFYYILFTVTISAAMRYGYRPALAMAASYVLFDAFEGLFAAQALSGPFVFRSGFILITAVLASYLREQAEKAESALQGRLRQAHLLNEVTAAIGASLDVDAVLEASALAAHRLFGGGYVLLRASRSIQQDQNAVFAGALPGHTSPVRMELEALCAEDDEGPKTGAQQSMRRCTLASGQQAIVIDLGLAERGLRLGTLAVAIPAGGVGSRLDPDVLESFIGRITLAIENASLYQTLTRRSEDLQHAYTDLAKAHQELLSLDEMKTNFLANVSHELRTPLTSIRAFSEMLLTFDEDQETRTEFLQIINSESERLTRLVNDVLDITKIESGHVEWHMEAVSMGGVLDDCMRALRAIADQRGVSLALTVADDLPMVRGDADRLQQVVSNLVGNALKFTERGSISARAEVVDGQFVRVSVTDTGIGIAAEDQERIFEKFQQVGDTLTDKPKGTGLGLAISREIAEHHGGRLWVESRLGQGSTFILQVPIMTELREHRELLEAA